MVVERSEKANFEFGELISKPILEKILESIAVRTGVKDEGWPVTRIDLIRSCERLLPGSRATANYMVGNMELLVNYGVQAIGKKGKKKVFLYGVEHLLALYAVIVSHRRLADEAKNGRVSMEVAVLEVRNELGEGSPLLSFFREPSESLLKTLNRNSPNLSGLGAGASVDEEPPLPDSLTQWQERLERLTWEEVSKFFTTLRGVSTESMDLLSQQRLSLMGIDLTGAIIDRIISFWKRSQNGLARDRYDEVSTYGQLQSGLKHLLLLHKKHSNLNPIDFLG